MNILFNGETATIKYNKKLYQFLILGNGIIPFGDNQDTELTMTVRNYIKANFKTKILKINEWQSIKEK